MSFDKPKLYRKVNTKTHRVHHDFGGDYKNHRNQKNDSPEKIKGAMHSKKARGLDYTPLYRFLLSKVGMPWDNVFSEAKARLDKTDPIFIMVSLDKDTKKDYIRVAESSYFSGLFVDDEGLLQLSNPDLKAEDMTPFCACCTHTLNGKLFGKKYSL